MKKLGFILFAIVLNMSSCNSSKENLPSEDFAKEGVMETIKIESEDKVELLEFKKTNALKENIHDVEYYTIDFEGKVAYKQNGYSLIYEDYDGKRGFLLVREDKPFSNHSYNYYGEVKKGDEKKIKGRIGFAKKEKGWEKIDVKIYLVDRIK